MHDQPFSHGDHEPATLALMPPSKNDVAIQLRTFGGDMAGFAMLIRTATPGENIEESSNLDDLADDAMSAARTFDGRSDPVEPTTAEVLLRLADRATMIAAAVREPNVSESLRVSIESLRNFVIRYPVVQTRDGLRFRQE